MRTTLYGEERNLGSRRGMTRIPESDEGIRVSGLSLTGLETPESGNRMW